MSRNPILMQVLHSLFHYEPYSGFTKSVQNKVGVQIAEFRTKKAQAKAKRMEWACLRQLLPFIGT